MSLQEIALRLSDTKSFEGKRFQCQLLNGETDVLQIIVETRDEFPIYLSKNDEQILCLSYLFQQSEVKKDKITELNTLMLDTNINIPLSSFSRLGDNYLIFGSLHAHSNFDDILHELVTLSDNTIDAIEALSDYLQ